GLALLGSRSSGLGALPRPDHVVVVIEENTGLEGLLASGNTPFIHSLVSDSAGKPTGALFTNSYGIGHPSQPNYFALFAGDTLGVTTNAPPAQIFAAPNLATALATKHLGFRAFSQSLGGGWPYARRHNPWPYFRGGKAYQVDTTAFPKDAAGYEKLPTVSFVVPNDYHDMHSGPRSVADGWLRNLVAPYLSWAATHNSLLILTWDESQIRSVNGRIPTIFSGPMVQPGRYDERIDHYSILRTIEDFYHLQHLGRTEKSPPITDVWKTNPIRTIKAALHPNG
ncbi:MAG: alkaline phosphatase family protein, partial [Rhodanobacteraceae bacterium]